MLVLDGSLPASLVSSRIANTGTSSTSITASETIASGHGRACTIRSSAATRERGAATADRAVAAGAPLATTEQPLRAARAHLGRRSATASPAARVSDAASTSSTASTAAIARPYMKLTPVANMPSRAITTVVAGKQDRAPGGVHRLDHRALDVAELRGSSP